MKDLEFPISPHLFYKGNSFEGITKVVERWTAKVTEGPWTQCDIANVMGKPSFTPLAGQMFALGEIGLAYILYRFRDIIDPNDARRYYRNGMYAELQTLLGVAHDKLMKVYGIGLDTYYYTHLDNELLGVLTSYTLVENRFICNLIAEAELDARVTRWIWKPTEMRVNIRGGIVKRLFHYGVQILNGETGHRALAFRSSLWTQSLNGMVYEFSTPIQERGYARHMPTNRLVSVVGGIEASLKENMLAEAFEQMAELPGSWVTRHFGRLIGDEKARATVKEKLSIAFEDDMDIYAPDVAIDAVYQLMETAANVNISAARLAQGIINGMVAELMHMPRKPGGEVVPDAIE